MTVTSARPLSEDSSPPNPATCLKETARRLMRWA